MYVATYHALDFLLRLQSAAGIDNQALVCNDDAWSRSCAAVGSSGQMACILNHLHASALARPEESEQELQRLHWGASAQVQCACSHHSIHSIASNHVIRIAPHYDTLATRCCTPNAQSDLFNPSEGSIVYVFILLALSDSASSIPTDELLAKMTV
jgi:hypothetical protein